METLNSIELYPPVVLASVVVVMAVVFTPDVEIISVDVKAVVSLAVDELSALVSVDNVVVVSKSVVEDKSFVIKALFVF